MPDAAVTDIRFHRAARPDRDRGLLGWVTFVFGRLRVDSVKVCRTIDRRTVLTFPTREDAEGTRHAFVLPTSAATQQVIQDEVIAYLRARGHIT